MPDPTLVFDVVHAELSFGEFVALVREGLGLFGQGFALLREAFCALPFVSGC